MVVWTSDLKKLDYFYDNQKLVINILEIIRAYLPSLMYLD